MSERVAKPAPEPPNAELEPLFLPAGLPDDLRSIDFRTSSDVSTSICDGPLDRSGWNEIFGTIAGEPITLLDAQRSMVTAPFASPLVPFHGNDGLGD